MILVQVIFLIIAFVYLVTAFLKSWTCTRENPFTQADQRNLIRGGIFICIVLALELLKDYDKTHFLFTL